MYQVIARKYRPQTFADVVNQEHVKGTLENAIAQSRIAHGYIFSGQRGTGKTTVARILARCLNCINGPTNQPCGQCASCLEIAAGGAPDVIEIDAASNRGINEMRELRENVRYRPVRDRYKVFIVDEAHQITNEAFNALLKTIEEPPSWVVFVLCTTEAHKIPATIASRCQHFSFRSVDFEDLVARMAWICGQEGIEADTDALAILAQAGEGSVRDSLSALDQAIACCGSKLNAADVRALLGAFSLESLDKVTTALSDGNSVAMLQVVDELERNGHNLQHFSRELARYFRNLLVAKVAGEDPRLIAASPAERARLAQTASNFSEQDLTRYLQLTLDIFKDLQESLQPRFHLEIGLVRLVQAGHLQSIEQALASVSGSSGQSPLAAQPPATARPAFELPPAPKPALAKGPSPFELDRAKKATRPEPQSMGANALAPAATPAPAAALAPAPVVSDPPAPNEWRDRLHAGMLELGMKFTADAVEHSEVVQSGNELQFTTPEEFAIYMRESEIQKAVQHIAGKSMRIKIKTGSVAAAPMAAVKKQEQEDDTKRRALENPEVQRFREVFGGEVRNVRNLKE
jgi:DNA polymerase III subunit gamma/tau